MRGRHRYRRRGQQQRLAQRRFAARRSGGYVMHGVGQRHDTEWLGRNRHQHDRDRRGNCQRYAQRISRQPHGGNRDDHARHQLLEFEQGIQSEHGRARRIVIDVGANPLNTNPGAINLTNVSLTDNLPVGMQLSSTPAATFTGPGCALGAGTITAVPNSTVLSVNGAATVNAKMRRAY